MDRAWSSGWVRRPEPGSSPEPRRARITAGLPSAGRRPPARGRGRTPRPARAAWLEGRGGRPPWPACGPGAGRWRRQWPRPWRSPAAMRPAPGQAGATRRRAPAGPARRQGRGPDLPRAARRPLRWARPLV